MSEEKKPPFCKNCKHAVQELYGFSCNHVVERIFGLGVKKRAISCAFERHRDGGGCGPDGKYFEPKQADA
jgi:hypothetical protein